MLLSAIRLLCRIGRIIISFIRKFVPTIMFNWLKTMTGKDSKQNKKPRKTWNSHCFKVDYSSDSSDETAVQPSDIRFSTGSVTTSRSDNGFARKIVKVESSAGPNNDVNTENEHRESNAPNERCDTGSGSLANNQIQFGSSSAVDHQNIFNYHQGAVGGENSRTTYSGTSQLDSIDCKFLKNNMTAIEKGYEAYNVDIIASCSSSPEDKTPITDSSSQNWEDSDPTDTTSVMKPIRNSTKLKAIREENDRNRAQKVFFNPFYVDKHLRDANEKIKKKWFEESTTEPEEHESVVTDLKRRMLESMTEKKPSGYKSYADSVKNSPKIECDQKVSEMNVFKPSDKSKESEHKRNESNDDRTAHYQHYKPVQHNRPKPVPGVCGLNNLGNTCYMNSALQCLSNIEILSDFVICYESSSKKRGAKRPLIEIYSILLRDMWSGNHSFVSPDIFKDKIGKLFTDFDGWAQKDCSELLTKVLYQFHEELMLKEFGIIPQLEEYNTFEEHLKNNNTLIGQNFQGYQRTITFCECGHIYGQNFDPFFVLDLPQIQNKLKGKLTVGLMISNKRYFDFELNLSNKIVFVSEMLTQIKNLMRVSKAIDESEIKNVNEKQVIVTDMQKNMIHKIYSNKGILDIEAVKGKILVYVSETALLSSFNFIVSLINTEDKAFGIPLQITSRSMENEDIAMEVCDQFTQNFERISISTDELRTMTNLHFHYIDVINQSQTGDGLTLITDPIPQKLFERYRSPKAKHFRDNSYSSSAFGDITIEDCLQSYLSLQKSEDTRRCQSCKSETTHYQRHDVMHAPNVLMIKLKTDPTKQYRYNQSRCQFRPQLEFDSFVSQPQSPKLVYHLNGISNYSGSAYSGHYTAIAKNYLNQKWYDFNDSHVEEVSNVCNSFRNAYLLVYCKSN